MFNSVELCVYGKYALFSDPITRVGGEKCSYQIPTYEALKGVLNSVYWKPTFEWVIDEVRVMNPIRMMSQGQRVKKYGAGNDDLAYYTYLCDVAYQIKAHFEWNLHHPEMTQDRIPGKHLDQMNRMIKKGGYRDIFLGTRECQAYVEPCCFGEGKGAYDDVPCLSFGMMLHGITYPDQAFSPEMEGHMSVNFWTPEMNNGVIKFIRPEECTVRKTLHEGTVKVFPEKHLENLHEIGGVE